MNKFQIVPFILSLKVEPFLLLAILCLSLNLSTLDQIIEDKLCRYDYNQTVDFCIKLSDLDSKKFPVKNEILASTTLYKILQTIIMCVPGIFWSLFIGAWCDRYLIGRKIALLASGLSSTALAALMMLNSVYFEWSTVTLVISYVPTSIFGSLVAALTGCYSYASKYTPPHLRAVRFALLEFSLFAGITGGQYIAGQILYWKKLFGGEQLHNFTGVYLLCGILSFVSFLWILFVINEKAEDLPQPKENVVVDMKESKSVTEEKTDHVDAVSESPNFGKYDRVTDHWYEPLKDILDIQHVKDVFKTATIIRSNNGRAQIWLLLLSMSCILMSIIGLPLSLFQFVQLVYKWDFAMYSTITPIGNIITQAGTLFGVPLLSRFFKMRDIMIAFIGILAIFMCNLVRGSILSPMGFYLSFIFVFFFNISPTGLRAHLSKIIEPEETTKLFSMIGTIESMTPMVSAFIFNTMFAVTIKSFPSCIIFIGAVLLFVPLSVVIWIDLKCTPEKLQQASLPKTSAA